jgi:hypothetical protein
MVAGIGDRKLLGEGPDCLLVKYQLAQLLLHLKTPRAESGKCRNILTLKRRFRWSI